MSSSDWYKGIGLSVFVSLITGASKLAIRKSWLVQHELEMEEDQHQNNTSSSSQPTEEECEQETEATSTDYLLSDDTVDDDSEDSESTSDATSSSTPPISNSLLDRPILCGGKNRSFQLNPRVLRYAGMFGMTVLNPLFSVIAMNYAAPSILAPFSGLALVWVILFSGMYLGETPSKPQIIATLLVVIGEVVVAIFGDHTNDSGVTVEEVAKSYSSPATISYFSLLAAYLLVLWYLIAKAKSPAWQRFAWGSCGGAITGPQNFIKDSLTVLKAVTSTPARIPWFFPLLIIAACATAFVGLLLFTAAMKRYNATYCAAAYVGSYVMSVSVNSAMHYHTFASLPGTWNDIMYPFGLLVLMAGVCLLEVTGEEEEHASEEIDDCFLEGITTTMGTEDYEDLLMHNNKDDNIFAYVRLETRQDDDYDDNVKKEEVLEQI